MEYKFDSTRPTIWLYNIHALQKGYSIWIRNICLMYKYCVYDFRIGYCMLLTVNKLGWITLTNTFFVMQNYQQYKRIFVYYQKLVYLIRNSKKPSKNWKDDRLKTLFKWSTPSAKYNHKVGGAGLIPSPLYSMLLDDGRYWNTFKLDTIFPIIDHDHCAVVSRARTS